MMSIMIPFRMVWCGSWIYMCFLHFMHWIKMFVFQFCLLCVFLLFVLFFWINVHQFLTVVWNMSLFVDFVSLQMMKYIQKRTLSQGRHLVALCMQVATSLTWKFQRSPLTWSPWRPTCCKWRPLLSGMVAIWSPWRPHLGNWRPHANINFLLGCHLVAMATERHKWRHRAFNYKFATQNITPHKQKFSLLKFSQFQSRGTHVIFKSCKQSL